jgi:hypothetical protein
MAALPGVHTREVETKVGHRRVLVVVGGFGADARRTTEVLTPTPAGGRCWMCCFPSAEAHTTARPRRMARAWRSVPSLPSGYSCLLANVAASSLRPRDLRSHRAWIAGHADRRASIPRRRPDSRRFRQRSASSADLPSARSTPVVSLPAAGRRICTIAIPFAVCFAVSDDRETRTHRRGRSKRSYGHCRRRTDISEAETSPGCGRWSSTAPTVNLGMAESQARRLSALRPRSAKAAGAGFESHLPRRRASSPRR